MARVFQDVSGGIIGLLSLSAEVWEALEADLARDGWSLDDIPERLSYRTVISMIRWTRPEDARHIALAGMREKQQQDQMAADIRETIEGAQAMGWGVND